MDSLPVFALAFGSDTIGAVLFVAVVLLVPLVAFFLLRRSRNGVLRGWREPLMDRSLQPLDAGTPEEWLAGRGALGGGVAGSAALKSAAVRAMWHESEPSSARAELTWRVEPDPEPRALAKATRKALRAARRSLPGRGEVRVTGDLRRLPGPDRITVHLTVRGQADDVRPWARRAEDAFATEFERCLAPGRRVRRET